MLPNISIPNIWSVNMAKLPIYIYIAKVGYVKT